MRKLLSLLLALTMLMTCGLTLAEETASVMPATNTTLTSRMSVDADTLKEALTQMGMGEEMTSMVDTVAALLNAVEEKLTIAGMAGQFDLSLNGETALSLAGGMTETGVNVASTLFPGHVLTFTTEEVSKLFEQLTAASGDGAGLDMNALMEQVTGYSARLVQAATSHVTNGTPETGDFVMDGRPFNTKMPINVDVLGMVNDSKAIVLEMLENDAVVGALKTVSAFGMPLDVDSLKEQLQGEVDPETIPTLEIEAYTNVTETGTDGTMLFTMACTMPGQAEGENPYLMGSLYQGPEGIEVDLNMPATGDTVTFTLAVNEAGPDIRVNLYQGSMYYGCHFLYNTDGAVVLEVYLMNPDKPVLVETMTVAQEGELTLSLEPGEKTAVTLSDLMGGNYESLIQDLTSVGLPALLSTLTSQVPEAAGLISAFMPPAE